MSSTMTASEKYEKIIRRRAEVKALYVDSSAAATSSDHGAET